MEKNLLVQKVKKRQAPSNKRITNFTASKCGPENRVWADNKTKMETDGASDHGWRAGLS